MWKNWNQKFYLPFYTEILTWNKVDSKEPKIHFFLISLVKNEWNSSIKIFQCRKEVIIPSIYWKISLVDVQQQHKRMFDQENTFIFKRKKRIYYSICPPLLASFFRESGATRFINLKTLILNTKWPLRHSTYILNWSDYTNVMSSPFILSIMTWFFKK